MGPQIFDANSHPSNLWLIRSAAFVGICTLAIATAEAAAPKVFVLDYPT